MAKRKTATAKVAKEKKVETPVETVKDTVSDTEVKNEELTDTPAEISETSDAPDVQEVESNVIPLEDIVVEDANLLPDESAAKATDIQQVSTEGVEQEKLPNVAEVDSEVKEAKGKKPRTATRTGDGKEKPADRQEEPGISRDDQPMNPEYITGRRSEFPRG